MQLRRLSVPPTFSVERARRAQRIIAERVVERDLVRRPVARAAGVDVTYRGDVAIGSAVVVDRKFRLLDSAGCAVKALFPYIPTLLAFREVGPAYLALRRLKTDYDVVFVDGNGRLHPFKAGFACHLGLVLRIPTIGVAKKLLCGEVGEWRGDVAPVVLNGEVIGAAVKTSKRAKPIYVSVGYGVTLETAVSLVKEFTKPPRKLPEPIAQAHIHAQEVASHITRGSSPS